MAKLSLSVGAVLATLTCTAFLTAVPAAAHAATKSHMSKVRSSTLSKVSVPAAGSVYFGAFTPGGPKEDFYVVVSRLVPYKRVDAVVEAFRAMPGRRLVVIGDGPQRAAIEARRPANVRLLGHAPHEAVLDHLRRARAFLFAGEEDFGIAPVEAMACGTPVIALSRGGLLETVVEGETGTFFDEPSPEAIAAAVERFDLLSPEVAPQRCRERAMQFSAQAFRERFRDFAMAGLARHARGFAA